ncbi:ribonuclease J [Candidatus Uhrbacteria bacterium]|nr:ribonuclease J [Candidatus Uhrbacteria bacterium]
MSPIPPSTPPSSAAVAAGAGPRLRRRGIQPNRGRPRPTPQPQSAVAPTESGRDVLRVIPIGGCDEVGKNMTILEYGNDILIMDMGVMFPEEDMPGVDFIIPNIKYLKGKERNIRGICITHGHFDHIGAVSYLAPRLGNPPIFGTPLTLALTKKRHEEFRVQPLRLHPIHPGEQIQLGCFRVEAFYESHNIPDSVGLIVHTPHGIIVNTGDFKFDLAPLGTTPGDIAKVAALADKHVLALLSDSTAAEKPGHQISESEITKNLDQIVKDSPGRIIVGLFSTLLSRIQQLLWIAEKHNRKVAIEGFSMRTNIEIARELHYMQYPKGLIVETSELIKLPPEHQMLLVTGAMGQDRAALMRIANKEHQLVEIEPGDTVIFSSSVIPGTERSVQRLKDNVARQGANVIHYQMMDVHSGGHGLQDDLKLMIKLVNPQYFIPIHGNYSFLVTHGKLAQQVGIPKENVLIPENGRVITFDRNGGHLTNERVPAEHVMVDGLGVGDVSEVVLRDRQQLAEDGMIVIIATIRRESGELAASPDLISRGFIHLKESKPLLEVVRQRVREIVESTADPQSRSGPIESYLHTKIREEIGSFLFQKTERRPMILPVIIEV